jgi:hypothetical protein
MAIIAMVLYAKPALLDVSIAKTVVIVQHVEIHFISHKGNVFPALFLVHSVPILQTV